MILPGSELMPVIRVALERGQRVRMTVTGSSMLPFIHNDDTVELEALRTPSRVGEIVLAQGTNDHYVVHRVVRAKGDIYLRGDAQTCREGPLASENVLGKVIQSERYGQVRNHTRGIWRILGQIWVSIHPVGFYLFRMYLEFRRMGGKALRRLQLLSYIKKTLRQKLNALRYQIPYFGQALTLVWRAARQWTIAWLILLLLRGVLPVASVYLTRLVVDSLVDILGSGLDWIAIQPTLLWVGLLALTLLLNETLNSLLTWVRTAQGELVSDHIYNLIHFQSIRLDMAFFETPEFYDQLHRARVDALNRPLALLENLGALLQNSITLLAMAAVLLSFGVWLPFALLLSTLPGLFVVIRYTLRFHQWRVANTANERRTRYYDWIITWHESAAELRLFDLGEHFRVSFQDLRAKLRNEKIQLTRGQSLAELGAGTLALLAMGASLVWIIAQAAQGTITLGDTALFYAAFSQGQSLLRSLLSQAGDIYRNLFFLENLFEFLNLEPGLVGAPEGDAAPEPPRGDICLEGVTFQYPDSQRVALSDFNLAIPAGQIVAIVGENGAGKSTLIKLLCRFYDPQTGSIRFGGTDLRQYPLEELRRQITVLFQEPVHYHESVTDNIAYGDLSTNPTREDVETAARAAGADAPIRKLSQGYDTVLGKWFGGAELSVGEWQRLALARAFLRRAQLIILDEPTSAMDSWAEADWLSRFRQLVAGRTALIVTHRFTTAMQADIIHVMDAGKIIESGTHPQLMALGGRYAQSWQQQTRNAY